MSTFFFIGANRSVHGVIKVLFKELIFFTMNAVSPWLLTINAKLNDPDLQPVSEQEALGYSFKVFLIGDSCWLVASWPKGSRIAFRLAYSPNDKLELKKLLE